MSQNGCGRYGQSGGCHPGVQGEDPDGQRTLTSWLNSAQMGVCSRRGKTRAAFIQSVGVEDLLSSAPTF